MVYLICYLKVRFSIFTIIYLTFIQVFGSQSELQTSWIPNRLPWPELDSYFDTHYTIECAKGFKGFKTQIWFCHFLFPVSHFLSQLVITHILNEKTRPVQNSKNWAVNSEHLNLKTIIEFESFNKVLLILQCKC